MGLTLWRLAIGDGSKTVDCNLDQLYLFLFMTLLGVLRILTPTENNSLYLPTKSIIVLHNCDRIVGVTCLKFLLQLSDCASKLSSYWSSDFS